MIEGINFSTYLLWVNEKRRIISFGMMGIGVIVLLTSMLADELGIGGYSGFGKNQAIGSVVGGLIIIVGLIVNKKFLRTSTCGYFIILVLLHFTSESLFLNLPPISIHSWAQADRGSVALNFAQESMNIFYPRLHRTEGGTGITGMEFPLVNWIVGAMYRLFGFHHIFFRGFMLLLVCLGLHSAFLMVRSETKRPFLSFLLVLFVSSSPVFLYYSFNFQPDTASVSIFLVGLYFFYLNHKNTKLLHLIVGTICFTLAGLIKVSILIAIFPFWISLFWMARETRHRWVVYVYCVLIMCGFIGAWYGYATYLSKKYSGPFSLTYYPIQSFVELENVLWTVWNVWLLHYLTLIQISTLLVSGIIITINYSRNVSFLVFGVPYVGAAVLYFVLMGKQFVYHDYYFVVIYPLIWGIQIWGMVQLLSARIMGVNRIKTAIVLVAVASILSGWYSGSYERICGKYHDWGLDLTKTYAGAEAFLSQVGVSRNASVFIGPDPTVEVSLYLVNRKGWQFKQEIEPHEFINIAEGGPQYIICSSQKFEQRPGIKEYLNGLPIIGHFRGINIYRINK